jgi:carbonic anhydrase
MQNSLTPISSPYRHAICANDVLPDYTAQPYSMRPLSFAESDVMLRSLLPGCVALSLIASPAYAHQANFPLQLSTAEEPLINKPLAEWSYDGEDDNQEYWGNLSVEYATCLLGLEQSPINVTYVDTDTLSVLATLYQDSSVRATYKNNALELAVDTENTLSIDGKNYTLKRIMFHSPGEHTVRDKFYVAEIQFIHEDEKGQMLIVSSFIETGDRTNNALDEILQQLPTKDGQENTYIINPSDLLPQKRGYYSYTGSLTYPPCTEGVQWRVLKHPIIITDLQLRSLALFLGRNSRMTQPAYNRVVKETAE